MWIQLVGQKVQKFQFEEFWSIMISYFLKSYQFKFYGLKTSIQTISRFFNHKLRIFTNFSTNQIDFSWKKTQNKPTRLVLIYFLIFKMRDWEFVKPCDEQLICAFLEKQVKGGAKNYQQKKTRKSKKETKS